MSVAAYRDDNVDAEVGVEAGVGVGPVADDVCLVHGEVGRGPREVGEELHHLDTSLRSAPTWEDTETAAFGGQLISA